jgi:hypothetical protein
MEISGQLCALAASHPRIEFSDHWRGSLVGSSNSIGPMGKRNVSAPVRNRILVIHLQFDHCVDPEIQASFMKVRGGFRIRNVTILGLYNLFNYYMFRSYDHLQA